MDGRGDANGRRRRLRSQRRLDRDDPRQAGARFLETHHVGAGVSTTAVGKRKHRRRRAQLFEDLERGGLLAL